MNLYDLAHHVCPPIFLVGGVVRDALFATQREPNRALALTRFFGSVEGDVDMCGALNGEELASCLGQDVEVHALSAQFGTYRIQGRGITAEYARFRQETYPSSGAHAPSSVTFGCTLVEDARRRDFTCNAIYFDVARQELIDPLEGVQDIHQRVLRAVAPDTLTHDGQRLFRLVRFATHFGLEIEDSTWRMAKENVALIDDLSPLRCERELAKTLNHFDQARAVRLFREMGLIERLGVAQCARNAEGAEALAKWRTRLENICK